MAHESGRRHTEALALWESLQCAFPLPVFEFCRPVLRAMMHRLCVLVNDHCGE